MQNEGHEDYRQPKQAYHYSYSIGDKEKVQHHYEESDGSGTVNGAYGYIDEKGIHRLVQYVADEHGFRAKINTNEPGTITSYPSDAAIRKDEFYEAKQDDDLDDEHHLNDNAEYHSSDDDKDYHLKRQEFTN